MMKTKYIKLLITVFALLIFIAGAILLKEMEPGGARPSADPDKTGALEWGFKFASAIPETPHLADRSKSQYEVLQVFLLRHMPDEAAKRADRIADWRECLSYGDLAVYFADKGMDEKAQFFIEQAQECTGKLTGWQTSWQKDRVFLRTAEAQVKTGRLKAAEKTESQLPVESALQVKTLRISRIRGPEDFEKSVKQLEGMESSEHMEVRRDVARAYIGILRKLGAKATDEQWASLQARVVDLTGRLPRLLQHETLCSLGRVAFAAGRTETGCRILEDAEDHLKSRGLNTRFDVVSLAELAGIWHEVARNSGRAESLLNEAKELLMKSGLRGMDQVRALISLAGAYRIQGSPDAAWDFCRRALHIAGSQTNARPRAMAITEICAAIGGWEKPLPEDMEKQMTRLYSALGEPW